MARGVLGAMWYEMEELQGFYLFPAKRLNLHFSCLKKPQRQKSVAIESANFADPHGQESRLQTI
jgi:hypothetical protein